MRISFDLDDTLICYDPRVPAEPLPWPRWLHRRDEPLRAGAVTLWHTLQAEGHEVWIYTTSYRDPRALRRWLRGYGLRADGIINQREHERFRGRNPHVPVVSKYPPAFGIQLHVDDLEGVRLEGAQHGFAVVVVAQDDRAWTDKVLEAASNPLPSPPPEGAGAGGKL